MTAYTQESLCLISLNQSYLLKAIIFLWMYHTGCISDYLGRNDVNTTILYVEVHSSSFVPTSRKTVSLFMLAEMLWYRGQRSVCLCVPMQTY